MECENSESTGVIRQRARFAHEAYRDKKRSLARDGHRLRLQDVELKLKSPTPDEFTNLCRELKKNKSPEILQRLRLGLASSNDYIGMFFKTQGALYTLVGCLTGQNDKLKREAACVLVNLSLGTEKQCREMCQRVGVYLLTNMDTHNPDLQDPCAWSLGNLCGNHESVCNIVKTQGGEEAIIKLLQSHSSHVIQSAAYALMHYMSTVPQRIQALVEAGAAGSLIKCLGRVEEGNGISEVGWCLFLISTNENLCSRLLDQGIVGIAFITLEKLINDQTLNVNAVTPLVRTLMNCAATGTGAAVQMCYRSEQLVGVIRALLYSPSSHLRTETLHLLSTIINAACNESETGKCLVSDLSLQQRLEGAVRSALASSFTLSPTTPLSPSTPLSPTFYQQTIEMNQANVFKFDP